MGFQVSRSPMLRHPQCIGLATEEDDHETA